MLRILPWARLVRLPNVFTAVGDVLMGYLFVHPSALPIAPWAALVTASVCLYWSGMVLNDIFDLEKDRRERPQRPLPAGDIRLVSATRAGVGLLIGGVLAAAVAGFIAPPLPGVPAWKSVAVAAVLACAIVGYDAGLKQTAAGPLFMGACRTANVLLGMSTGPVVADYVWRDTGFDAAQWSVAGGLGLYICGVTLFARREAGEPHRGEMTLGVVVMAIGLSLVAAFPFQSVCQAGRYPMRIPHDGWPWVVGILALPLARRAWLALRDPTAARIGGTVKACLLALLVFDAAICLQVYPHLWGSLLILSLLAPTLLLGRWFYST